jgi:hypothetical protein
MTNRKTTPRMTNSATIPPETTTANQIQPALLDGGALGVGLPYSSVGFWSAIGGIVTEEPSGPNGEMVLQLA